MGNKSGHAEKCAWHLDQYPWECTCGVYEKRNKAMEELIADSADMIDLPNNSGL